MKKIELKDFGNKSDLKVVVEIDKTVFIASISGNISNIDFPPIEKEPKRKNELWTIGCFEIFVSLAGNSYNEYNFGFDECWECFNFTDYRRDKTRQQFGAPPKITCSIAESSFTQHVEFNEDIICCNAFSITAVIKLKNGEFLYFAEKHCGDKPDFHLAELRTAILFPN